MSEKVLLCITHTTKPTNAFRKNSYSILNSCFCVHFFYRMWESAVSLLVLLLVIRIILQHFFPSFIQKNYRKSYDYFLIESIFVYNCQNIPFKMWDPNDHLATLFIDFYYVVKKRCECISSSTSKRIQPESKFFYFTNIASPKLKKRYLSSIAWW